MSSNPYASPSVTSSSSEVALFTPAQVAGASFCGTPLAGASLMALNHLRLGRPGDAVATLISGLIAMLFLAVASVYLLSAVPMHFGTLIGLGYMYGMRQIAQSVQGDEVDAHVAAGGATGSVVEVIGVTVLSLAVAVGAIVAVVSVGG